MSTRDAAIGNSSSNTYRVQEVKELKNLPFPAKAADILNRLQQCVAPLTARRRWRVGVLKEFYPKNASLLGLNVNGGSSIMVRLREPRDSACFLPWESILGTMIHELVHCAISQHSAEFYSLVDQLHDEVDVDMISMRGQHGINYGAGSGDSSGGTGKRAFSGAYRTLLGSVTNSDSSSSGSSSSGGCGRVLREPSPLLPATQKAGLAALHRNGLLNYAAADDLKQPQLCVEISPTRRRSLAAAAAEARTKQKNSAAVDKKTAVAASEFWECLVCLELNESTATTATTSAAASDVSSDRFCCWCGVAYGKSLIDSAGGELSAVTPTVKQEIVMRNPIYNTISSSSDSDVIDLTDESSSSSSSGESRFGDKKRLLSAVAVDTSKRMRGNQ